tara:strand:- start:77721 stop:78275 length:555 start_codon:yes stop_codon:yes gene_type:complete
MMALLLMMFAVTACSTSPGKPLIATTDYNTSYDFSKVRAIAIQPRDPSNPVSVQISDMQADRLNHALTQELQVSGYEVVNDNAKADLYLVWHLVTQDKTDIRSYNSMSYYNCWRCGPVMNDVSVNQYTEGTFIVDLVDPIANQSVWRATLQSRLKAEPDPQQAEIRRMEAAQAIFAGFPPPPGS